MLTDTQELISNILNKNYSVYEDSKDSPTIKNFLRRNNNKKNNEIQTIKVFNTGQNNKKRKDSENSEDSKDENNKIISKRINVINNNLGEETNRMNKSHQDSQENIIQSKKSNIHEDNIKTKKSKSLFKYNVTLIDKKKPFNCCDYLFYLILCKQVNPHIKYYEELRKQIISEESMFHNYFYIKRS